VANVLYPLFKQSLLNKELDLDTDDFRVILLGNGYTYSAAHQFVSDLTPGANEISRSTAALAAPTIALGVFDATDLLFPLLAGAEVKAAVVFAFAGGADAARKLVCYIDTGTGFPFTPSGADWTLKWNVLGIFAL